ncbi:MAG TPA: TetR/AcrR family transcriptional regulator [Ktedonobacterales bacterium]|jgi:AcrR family transcriptional regulator
MSASQTTEAMDAMDTRERILYETWRMLEQRRGQSVRLEDIAQAASVSRQAIYLHFGSRSELFIATVRYVDDHLHMSEQIRAICEAESNVGIASYIAWWASYILEIHGLARALLTLRQTDEAAAAAWADRMQAFRNGCLEVMKNVESEGNLAHGWTVKQAADFLWALMSVETWEHLTLDCGWSKEQYIERMQVAARRALTNQATAP